ncbi:DUF4118 domain-containing protein [Actinopolymorpha alba]|uniref:DUF4118 domain-containing protein n=1 Tax=Actinopolymorpha alba TaxID=533267 RepID=UPI0003724C59|nr:DUF4118 domain-containing protein [Actinopolymorpha alba]
MSTDSTLRAQRPWIILAALAAPPVVCAVLAVFRESVANTNATLVLVLLVVAVAATGIRSAGIIAALSSAVWFDFFLTAPYHRFAITDQADIETTVLLLLVGAGVSELALWGRRHQASASREQGYLSGVLDTAAAVAAGQTSASVLIDHVAGQIVELLGIDDCRFVPGPSTGLPVLQHDGTVTRNSHRVNVERDGLPTDTETAIVVQRGGATYGHFLLTAATGIVRPSLEQRRVAVTLANQVGPALESPRD